jgi:hypothetical protein
MRQSFARPTQELTPEATRELTRVARVTLVIHV